MTIDDGKLLDWVIGGFGTLLVGLLSFLGLSHTNRLEKLENKVATLETSVTSNHAKRDELQKLSDEVSDLKTEMASKLVLIDEILRQQRAMFEKFDKLTDAIHKKADRP